MRSRKAVWAVGVLLGAWSFAAHCAEDTASAIPPSAAISQAAIDSAIAELKHDPNLGGQTKVRTLKWSSASKPTPPEEMPQWILAFFEYVSQLSGVLLWALGAIAVAVAAVWGYRNLRMQWPRVQMADSEPATGRILDLDISPDSLPGDVGAAALALSSDGRIREALSLLYRAALSRAVNRFGAVIGPSLTEREALGAVRASLDESRANYFAQLLLTRQRVVYAGDVVAPDDVAHLCRRFGDLLDGGLPR